MNHRHAPKKQPLVECSLCHRQTPANESSTGAVHRQAIFDFILAQHPGWDPNSPICFSCLNQVRAEFVKHAITEEKGQLSQLELEVVQSLKEQDTISENINTEYDSQLTFGQRVADHIAEFGGSWAFIGSFALLLALWILFNEVAPTADHFDPFPYILLNLILSCLAAIQAPVIMMSQNRQEAKDRMRAEHDYKVNLKAELEIRHLHTKLDQLMSHQWQRLLEIQEIQMQMMEDAGQSKQSH